MIAAVVLDMDGLMLDTEAMNRVAWKAAAAEQGYDLTDTFYATLIGQTTPVSEQQVVDHFGAGFSRDLFGGQPLPLALDFLGMTGCVLHASIDALTVAVASGGVSQFDMTVPTNSALIGATFFAQTLVIDPAANSAGVTASNALSFTIGRR